MNILSIDGGGIRGIIPAILLAHIEEQTGKPIGALFDLIIGTSTGGLLALLLTAPDSTGAARYPGRSLPHLYLTSGADIFDKPSWRQHPIGNAIGAVMDDELYDHAPLERVLQEYLGDLRMGDAIRPTVLTAYDIRHGTTLFFKSWKPQHRRLLMRHCARATSAAPTYFEPMPMTVGRGKQRDKVLIDGGVFINNPAMSGYVEAVRRGAREDIVVVSLGTGSHSRSYSLEDAQDWSHLAWLKPLMGCVFDGVSEAVDYQLHQLLGTDYYRFQTRLDNEHDALDNSGEANLEALQTAARRLMRRERGRLAELIARLAAKGAAAA